MIKSPRWTAEKIRNKMKADAGGRMILWLLSWLYLAVIATRAAFYRLGLLKSISLPVRVVCFGNLSAGGTGKTSTVVAAAIAMKKQGANPAVLIRGYGRSGKKSDIVVLHPSAQFQAEAAGDEALMMYNMLRPFDIPVLVGGDRVHTGMKAIEMFKSDILLMDDGYQFFKLRRDADVVLVNATSPFHADALLPLGNLRESSSGLKRAAAIIISHCEHVAGSGLETILTSIRRINPNAPVIESMHEPEVFINALTKESVPLTQFKGESVVALSGIGDPKSFENALSGLEIGLSHIWRYPDHHRFTHAELSAIESTRNGLPVITTYKDFARFPSDWPGVLKGGVFILSVKITFRRNGREALMQVLAPGKKIAK